MSVLGSYKPATGSPDSLTTLLAMTILVLPKPFEMADATRLTLLSLLFASSSIAPRKSPASNLAITSLDNGAEVCAILAVGKGIPIYARSRRTISEK